MKEYRKALSEMRRSGRVARREIRRTRAAEIIPPTLLGRSAHHARSAQELAEAGAAIVSAVAAAISAAVATREAWSKLRARPTTQQEDDNVSS